jgi:hypothetical protein
MGLSSSSSASSQTTNNTQVTGGSGNESPTVAAGGNVIMTDEGATKDALSGMQTVSLAALNDTTGETTQALDLLSNFNAGQVQQNENDQANSNALLSSVLASNASLAQNQQSGGATDSLASNTKIIYAALAAVALIIVVFLFHK